MQTTTARWIGEPIPEDWSDNIVYPPILLRRRFPLPEQAPATLEITALGLYEVFLNGARVGDHHLAPEWTDYRSRVQMQSFDVGSLLRWTGDGAGSAAREDSDGWNELLVSLADGWYSGRVGLSY